MVSLALAEDYRKAPEYRQELHMENVLRIIDQSNLNQKTKNKINQLNTYDEIFTFLQSYYGYEFPLKPDYYSKFPVLLLRVATENARNSAVNIKHVKELAKSYRSTGIIKPPLVTINGLIPDGGHRDLAAVNERAEFISIVVGDFEKGARISAASDSQVKYADYNIVMAIAKSASYGVDINDLVAVSNKKRDTVNSYIRFGLNSTPELKFATLEKGLPLSHAISISRLCEQDQKYILKTIMVDKHCKSSRDWVDTSVSNLLSTYKKRLTIEDLIEQSQGKDIYNAASEEQIFEICKNGAKPTYQVSTLNFNLQEQEPNLNEVTNNTKMPKNPLEEKTNMIFGYLSKLYQLGFIKQEDLKNAHKKIHPTILKNILKNNETLVSRVKKHARKHKLEKKIFTFEEAFKEVSKGFEEGKTIKAAYDLEYLLSENLENVIPSTYNVRGTLEDTAKSALELVDSIIQHGVLQPVLAYKNDEEKIEVICGNRRHLAFRIAQAYAKLNNIKSEKLETLPILLIKDKVSEADIIKLQIAEDSQRLFSPLEKGALYCQIMTQYKQQGINSISARAKAIKEIQKSTGYTPGYIKRQMNYWENMSESIKDAYSHRIVNTEILDALIEIDPKTKTEMKTILAQSLLTGKRKKAEIVQMYEGNSDKMSQQFDFINEPQIGQKITKLFRNNKFDLGHTISQYIRNSL